MPLNEFELILYQTYIADLWLPPAVPKFREEFEEISLTKWATYAVFNYMRESIAPLTTANIDTYISIINEFANRVARCAIKYPRKREAFNIARLIAEDVIDLLNAMR